MINALIDNATLSGIKRLLMRKNRQLLTREINIQSLDSLLEAYVLNESVYVDEVYWNELLKVIPREWNESFAEVVSPINIDFIEHISLEKFLKSEIAFFVLNMFIDFVKKEYIYEDFLSYTGADFGSYFGREDRMNVQKLSKIEKILKDTWDWDYYSADIRHIDCILMAYRTMNYIDFAEKNNFNLVTHDIRNQFISTIGYAYNLNIPNQTNYKIYRTISNIIKENHSLGIVKEILNGIDDGEIFWQSVNVPFVPALIYENCKNVENIFHIAEKYRQKFKPYRNIVEEFDNDIKNNPTSKADKFLSEINNFTKSLSENVPSHKIDYSFSIGFPLSYSLGLTGKTNYPSYLKIFKDLMYRYSLPYAYVNSCKRLFGSIRWNRTYGYH